jgi:hypothetical protein
MARTVAAEEARAAPGRDAQNRNQDERDHHHHAGGHLVAAVESPPIGFV